MVQNTATAFKIGFLLLLVNLCTLFVNHNIFRGVQRTQKTLYEQCSRRCKQFTQGDYKLGFS